MANLRKIRMRIKSVESTRQITRSMKMVAAAKLRKTQQAYSRLRVFADGCAAIYARTCRLLPQAAPEREKAGEDALDAAPDTVPAAGRTCYVLIAPDRGLCGTYGHALLRYFRELLEREEGERLVYTAGRWGRELLGPVDGSFPISDAPGAEEARGLTEALCALYREGKADRILLVFQRFRSVLQQEPGYVQLLPAAPPEADEGAAASEAEIGVPPILEPDGETVLRRLRELYLQSTVHSALLEARTGEHAARMTAMTAATDNTEELISKLTLELNHARQAAITTEISEIVGGAAALRQNDPARS